MSFHHNLEGLDLHAPSNRTVENNTASAIEVFRAITFASAGIGTKFIEIRKGDGAVDFLRGITSETISTSGVGIITQIGTLLGVDTSAFTVGDLLYADASGVLSTVINGAHIAEVLKVNGTDGIVYVDLRVTASASGAGEANTASNLGSGEGVFASKSAVNLEFKSLVGGSGIQLTSNASEITITASANVITTQTLDASARVIGSIGIAEDTSASFKIRGHGRENATGDTLSVDIIGCIRNEGGTTTMVGAPFTQEFNDAGASIWDVTAVANDSTDALDIVVTGEAAHTIDWKFQTETIEE